MKVLVVGASGFIGRATLQALVKRHGEKVQAYAGVRDVAKFGEMDKVTVIQADMGSREELAKTLKAEKFDGVYLVVPGHENRTQIALEGIKAAKDADVKFLLVLSVLTSGSDSIFGKQFEPIEAAAKSSGLKHALYGCPCLLKTTCSMLSRSKVKTRFMTHATQRKITLQCPSQTQETQLLIFWHTRKNTMAKSTNSFRPPLA